MKVRSATRDELETLKAFEQGIIAAERPYDHTLKPDPVSYYDIGELIDSDDAEVAVVEVDGQLVASGYARTKESKSYVQDTHHAYLGFMYVRPGRKPKACRKCASPSIQATRPQLAPMRRPGSPSTSSRCD